MAAAAAVEVDPYQEALKRLKSSDPFARRKGAEELGHLRRAAAVEPLMQALGDKHPAVRSMAADSLGLLRAVQAGGFLARMLSSDKDPAVRQSAATALAYLGDPSSAAALIGALGDGSLGVRYASVRALGALRAVQASSALAKALSDPDVGLRRSAASALGSIGGVAAVPALSGALTDRDPSVRLLAASALGALGDVSALPALKTALAAEKDAKTRSVMESARDQLQAASPRNP